MGGKLCYSSQIDSSWEFLINLVRVDEFWYMWSYLILATLNKSAFLRTDTQYSYTIKSQILCSNQWWWYCGFRHDHYSGHRSWIATDKVDRDMLVWNRFLVVVQEKFSKAITSPQFSGLDFRLADFINYLVEEFSPLCSLTLWTVRYSFFLRKSWPRRSIPCGFYQHFCQLYWHPF